MAHMPRMTEQEDDTFDSPVSLGSPTSALLVKEMLHVLTDEATFTWVFCCLQPNSSITEKGIVPEASLLEQTSPHCHLEAPNQWPQRKAKRQAWSGGGHGFECYRWLRTRGPRRERDMWAAGYLGSQGQRVERARRQVPHQSGQGERCYCYYYEVSQG